MKNKSLLALLAIPLAGMAVVGSAALASNKAQQNTTPTPAQVVTQQDVQDLKDSNMSEAEESKALQSQAKITPDQAKQIAEQKTGHKVTEVILNLSDEDGTIVYDITAGDKDVEVNAIDGSIYKIEQSDGETDDDESDDDTEVNDDGANSQ